jgi:hypothetical protein
VQFSCDCKCARMCNGPDLKVHNLLAPMQICIACTIYLLLQTCYECATIDCSQCLRCLHAFLQVRSYAKPPFPRSQFCNQILATPPCGERLRLQQRTGRTAATCAMRPARLRSDTLQDSGASDCADIRICRKDNVSVPGFFGTLQRLPQL